MSGATPTDTALETTIREKCSGVNCENGAGSLQCPTCLELGMQSFFCSQNCFKSNWRQHKAQHKSVQANLKPQNGFFNPFPTYPFTGTVRPVYPLSPKRTVPPSIRRPDWAKNGIPEGERRYGTKWSILDANGQEAMREVCRRSREVLDIVAAEIRPGISTDYLDEICHNACIERNAYPSPLNYNHFPKSLCTSPNEVVCHGIPDGRILQDGDILNLDISLYYGGHHADVNETYYVGDRAKSDPDSIRVVETARECLDAAIRLVRPGTPIRDFGKVIEKHAKSRKCSVIATWGGHGIGTEFHPPPWIPHYAKNKAAGVCKPGMTFTIEPILSLGGPREQYWPDDWTNVTVDGKRTAQFEHTLLVTEAGVEVLTARNENSPGGPIPLIRDE